MASALRWAAMRAILMFHNCDGQSHKTVSTDHNFWRKRRAEAVSNRGPSAYQPNALPLGQTGSRGERMINVHYYYYAIKKDRRCLGVWAGSPLCRVQWYHRLVLLVQGKVHKCAVGSNPTSWHCFMSTSILSERTNTQGTPNYKTRATSLGLSLSLYLYIYALNNDKQNHSSSRLSKIITITAKYFNVLAIVSV